MCHNVPIGSNEIACVAKDGISKAEMCIPCQHKLDLDIRPSAKHPVKSFQAYDGGERPIDPRHLEMSYSAAYLNPDREMVKVGLFSINSINQSTNHPFLPAIES